MGSGEFGKNMKNVFGNWKYVLLAVFIAMGFYLINVVIANFGSLVSFYSSLGFLGTLNLFFLLSVGFYETIDFYSFFSLGIISIMFGVLFSLLVFKVKSFNGLEGKTGVFASAGLFLGVLVPGCAACGVGLLSVLGLGAAVLTFLPFDGLEISVLSIGILAFAIFKTSKELNSCKINK